MHNIRVLDNSGVEEAQGVEQGVGLRVRLDKSTLPKTSGRPLIATLRGWYYGSALQALLHELRNLPRRIAAEIEIYEFERRGYRGKTPATWDRSEVPLLGTLRHDHIQYMQQIQVRRPHLSVVDLHLVSEVWKDGSVSGARFCNGQNQIENSSASPKPNSIPRLEARQLSTRDLSDPPPLQESLVMTDECGQSCTKQNTGSRRLSGSQASLNTHSSGE